VSHEENKVIVHRFLDEGYNKRNLAVGDELLTANSVLHWPGGDATGPEGWKRFATGFLTAFPDLHVSIEDIVGKGDKVVVRWMSRGTHEGELQGTAPTGKKVTVMGMGIYRLVSGKIQEIWGLNDKFGMLQQLGAIPPSGAK